MDILFGFAYDERVTMGDGNCESAWTVFKKKNSHTHTHTHTHTLTHTHTHTHTHGVVLCRWLNLVALYLG